MRIVPIGELMGAIWGVSTDAGNLLRAACNRSVTNCRAWKISVPQLKITRTTEILAALDERTALTPAVPLMALSIGNVTSDSTSSGANPAASVWISTCGGAKGGNTSKGIWIMVRKIQMVRIIAPNITNQRRAIAHLMKALSMKSIIESKCL